MKNYNEIREWLSEQEHIQWEHWSNTLSKELFKLKEMISNGETDNALHLIEDRLDRWELNWIPYNELKEEIKEYDREWADKILDNIPFKCPVYQCGGIMTVDYPKIKDKKVSSDGMVIYHPLPDLVCTNCQAVYEFKKFRRKK